MCTIAPASRKHSLTKLQIDSARLENENAAIDRAEGVAPEQGDSAARLPNLQFLRLKYQKKKYIRNVSAQLVVNELTDYICRACD